MRFGIGTSPHASADGGTLGVAYQAGRWSLAALPSSGEAPLHVASVVAAIDDLPAGWAQLTEGLPASSRDWPASLVLPSGRVLHRAIELPDADPAAIRQVLSLRVEGWLGTGGRDVRFGWANPVGAASQGRRWVVVAPAEVVDASAALFGRINGPRIAVSVSDAVALAWSAQVPRSERIADAELLVVPDAQQTTMVLRDRSGLLGCEHLDVVCSIEPVDVWRFEVLDAAASLAEAAGLSPESIAWRWLVEESHVAQARAWSAALGLRSTQVEAVALGRLLAVGAARALAANAPTIALSGRDDAAARGTVPRWAWIAAAVAVLGAAGLWAWSDLRAAAAIESAEAVYPALTRDSLELRRQLDLFAYLETRPPTLLAMLDEITEKASGFDPKTLRYDADGDLEMAGVLASAGQIGTLVAELAQMRTLAAAQLRSQKIQGRDEVAYDISAQPSRRFFEAFVPVPRSEAPADKPPMPQIGGDE